MWCILRPGKGTWAQRERVSGLSRAEDLFITSRSSGQHQPVLSTPWRGAQHEGCRGLPPVPHPGASARAQRSSGTEPGAPHGNHTLQVPTHNAAEEPKISASRAGTADSEVPPTAEGVYSKPYAQQGNSSFRGTPTLELGGDTPGWGQGAGGSAMGMGSIAPSQAQPQILMSKGVTGAWRWQGRDTGAVCEVHNGSKAPPRCCQLCLRSCQPSPAAKPASAVPGEAANSIEPTPSSC